MNFVIELIKTDEFLLINFFINIILIFVLVYFIIISRKKDNNNLENKKIYNILKKNSKEIKCIKDENEKLREFCNKLDKDISKTIQKVKIVKYNAFENITGNLSFVIILLDRENTGIIVNSIYGTNSSNIYAKIIEKGKAKTKLSEEEKEALQQAIKPM